MIEQDAHALILQAVNQHVSDIHLLPNQNTYLIGFRMNGSLHPIQEASLDWGKRLIAYFKFLANMDVGERRRPQSGACDFPLETGGDAKTSIELRFSTICNVDLLESLVIRVIFSHHHQADFINTPYQESIHQLRQLIQHKSGLVLFSGPVGSGKTTTIYQLLRERIHQVPLQVITMEDPVEIREPLFLQTQVNQRADISYDQLIKAALRHHPDVLFIGEIRDEETAKMTVRGALTGHLMIATIHAKDTLGVLARLGELGVSRQLLYQSLIGIVSQRLVPQYCPQCQKNCDQTCCHIDKDHQRTALFEILTGDLLKEAVLNADLKIEQYDQWQKICLNQQLKKAWQEGIIHESTYEYFKLV